MKIPVESTSHDVTRVLPVLGTQQWHDLLFLHWRLPAAVVQATLPPGLVVDTFDGEAWVGIVPFAMARVRPRFLPPLPWLSGFLELNVRTYVRDRQGVPGVWFHSLDCNQPIAVEIARTLFHLPYRHARMTALRTGEARRYQCRRYGESGAPWSYAWEMLGHAEPARPGTLDQFLVERYVLYAADRKQRLYRGRISHAPYRTRPALLHEYSIGPAALAGFALEGAPVSVLAAEPVQVQIHPLVRIA